MFRGAGHAQQAERAVGIRRAQQDAGGPIQDGENADRREIAGYIRNRRAGRNLIAAA